MCVGSLEPVTACTKTSAFTPPGRIVPRCKKMQRVHPRSSKYFNDFQRNYWNKYCIYFILLILSLSCKYIHLSPCMYIWLNLMILPSLAVSSRTCQGALPRGETPLPWSCAFRTSADAPHRKTWRIWTCIIHTSLPILHDIRPKIITINRSTRITYTNTHALSDHNNYSLKNIQKPIKFMPNEEANILFQFFALFLPISSCADSAILVWYKEENNTTNWCTQGACASLLLAPHSH